MPRTAPLLALLSLTVGCAYISDEDAAWRLDPDGDGVKIGQDCDDADGSVGASVTWWVDADGDGYGDPGTESSGCAVPDEAVANGEDCDDAAADVYPGASDEWYDGVDSDCAGNDDHDQDGDGYGVDVDCDDTDASLAPDPSIPETYFNGVDDNCDLSDSDGDQDGDGYWAWDYVNRCNANSAVPLEIPAGAAGDCWDDPETVRDGFAVLNGFSELTAAQVHPGAAERYYDGVDQDCLGIDANDDGVPDDFDWDLDGDASWTWPDRSGTAGGDCLDCDCGDEPCPDSCDGEADNPGGVAPADANSAAAETWYDGTDQDCRGDDDLDRDGDGFECDPSYGGLCAGGDCDDERVEVYPGAPDTWYDGIDSDCGGEDDYDQDGDGYVWDLYGGYDCNDTDSTISPAATETWYDGLDEDCDGWDDYDQDYDGYRSAAEWSSGDDCDDTNAAANPGQTEIEGNGFDDDCSGDSNGNQIEGSTVTWVAEAMWFGTSASDSAGRHVAAAGDVDGDGSDDFLVGAPYNDVYGTNSGQLYIVSGDDATSSYLSGSEGALYGSSTTAYLGFSGVGVGDQDGDGYDDVVIAEYTDTISNANDGVVYVALGPITGTVEGATVAEGMYWGAYDGSQAGRTLAPGGDHDGDGTAVVLLGAPADDWDGSNAGRVWLVSGPLTGVSSLGSHVEISPESGDGEYLGDAAIAADLTGDGQDDLALGAPYFHASTSTTTAGAVYVLAGPVTADATVGSGSTARLVGGATNAYAGEALAAGDLDDDGYQDLVVGAPYDTPGTSTYEGAVYVVHGPVTTSGALSSVAAVRFIGQAQYGELGRALAVGDLNGDGKDDLVIGEPGARSGSSSVGAAWFLHGPVTASGDIDRQADAVRWGQTGGDFVGGSLAVIGDGDSDGYDDVVVGAQGEDVGGSSSGAAFLFYGGAL